MERSGTGLGLALQVALGYGKMMISEVHMPCNISHLPLFCFLLAWAQTIAQAIPGLFLPILPLNSSLCLQKTDFV